MTTLQMILGILAFALATAVLYVWGLHKSITQRSDLEHILLSKGSQKVVHRLKRQQSISLEEMAQLCRGITAGQFWSRQRASVRNPQAFAPQLAQYMQQQLLLERLPDGRFTLRPQNKRKE